MVDDPGRRRWLKLAKQLLGIGLVAWLIYYLAANWQLLTSVLDVRWYHLLGTGAGIIVTWTLMSVQGMLLLRSVGVEIGFREHLMLQLASILANYLPLRMGPVLRLHYLKQVHRLRYARFGSLLGMRAILLIGASGLAGLLAVGGRWLAAGLVSPPLAVIFGGMVVAATLAYLVPLPTFDGSRGRVARAGVDLVDGIRLARRKPRLMAWVLGLIVAQILVVGGRAALTYDAVDVEAEPSMVLSVAALAAVVNLLAFTMGSLGLREATIGFVTAASGHDFSNGVFAGLVDRALLMALAYPLGLLGLVYVRSRLARAERAGEPPAGPITGP